MSNRAVITDNFKIGCLWIYTIKAYLFIEFTTIFTVKSRLHRDLFATEWAMRLFLSPSKQAGQMKLVSARTAKERSFLKANAAGFLVCLQLAPVSHPFLSFRNYVNDWIENSSLFSYTCFSI